MPCVLRATAPQPTCFQHSCGDSSEHPASGPTSAQCPLCFPALDFLLSSRRLISLCRHSQRGQELASLGTTFNQWRTGISDNHYRSVLQRPFLKSMLHDSSKGLQLPTAVTYSVMCPLLASPFSILSSCSLVLPPKEAPRTLVLPLGTQAKAVLLLLCALLCRIIHVAPYYSIYSFSLLHSVPQN